MNLRTKKILAASALKVGVNRIRFEKEGLSEIKEAITKQDMISLKTEGIIKITPVKGRKKVERRKRKRGPGKIKKKINTRKQDYVKLTRKLRKYLRGLRERGAVDKDLYIDLRKKIRAKSFKSLANFKDNISTLMTYGEREDIKKKKEKKIEKTEDLKRIEKAEDKKETEKKNNSKEKSVKKTKKVKTGNKNETR